MCLMIGQKKLKDKYKDPNVLPKMNKSDMAGMMEAIKEYIRLCHGIAPSPLANAMWKTIVVQTYGGFPTYATPDDKMIFALREGHDSSQDRCSNSPCMYAREQDRQQDHLLHP